MDNFFVATALKYYKRREVQEAIVRHAAHREVSPRYGQGFGKRPDVLENPTDVLEFAKRKATSFHCSEERWQSPLQIVTGMPRKEADGLRIGWDLVLDIDAKDWEISRLTAWLFVEALRAHGVRSISAKFSGNKGWHIGVPFEAFTSSVVDAKGHDVHMSSLFPEMPRAVAAYLVDYIGDPRNGLVSINDDEMLFGGKIKTSLSQLAEKAGKTKQEILEWYSPSLGRAVSKEGERYKLLCPSCAHQSRTYTAEEKGALDDKERVCPKCRSVMDFHRTSRKEKADDAYQRFKITEVIEFDTVLLAPRHLYRMPYALHEKSGLASAVIDPDGILSFRKEDASPDSVSFERTFLDSSETSSGEAAPLVAKAWEAVQRSQEKRSYARTEYDVPDEAIAEEHFPPCMQGILSGMKDGKKRALFALVNFLRTNGWSPEMIDKRVHEWNDSNPEPLREVNVKGHLKHHLGKKLVVLPPNCMQFYRELGVCSPDDLCRTVRNPAQYAAKKSGMGKKQKRKRAPKAHG